jgi:hypothetical protein
MTIIATGMGIPMIDFVVRECRYVDDERHDVMHSPFLH